MEILKLRLVNFRNFSTKNLEFDKKLTVILGNNGAGKTNILEAIALVSGLRSQRAERDLDLVTFSKTDAKVEANVSSGEEEHDLVINYQIVAENYIRKAYFLDTFKKRLQDFIPIFSIIVFEPSDLDLVSGSPSFRRKHLDVLLSSVDRDYWRNISAYQKIVTRRNKILHRIQEGKSKPLELNFWDERLLEHAQFISKKREEFFEFLNFVERGDEFGGFGELSWMLHQSLVTEEKLQRNRERDISAGVTLSGPHRDDFMFVYRGHDLAFFGSRGEQRMAVLALKLGELEFYKSVNGQRPVLALDDIFSELDWEHREIVLSVIGNQQTIITAAEKESVPKEIFKKAKAIEI